MKYVIACIFRQLVNHPKASDNSSYHFLHQWETLFFTFVFMF